MQWVQNTATIVLKIYHICIDPYEIWAELWFFKTDMYSDILELRENRREFLNGVFCILLSRPFDKIDMTIGQGQWPRVTGRTRVNQCALLLEKSVCTSSSRWKRNDNSNLLWYMHFNWMIWHFIAPCHNDWHVWSMLHQNEWCYTFLHYTGIGTCKCNEKDIFLEN